MVTKAAEKIGKKILENISKEPKIPDKQTNKLQGLLKGKSALQTAPDSTQPEFEVTNDVRKIQEWLSGKDRSGDTGGWLLHPSGNPGLAQESRLRQLLYRDRLIRDIGKHQQHWEIVNEEYLKYQDKFWEGFYNRHTRKAEYWPTWLQGLLPGVIKDVPDLPDKPPEGTGDVPPGYPDKPPKGDPVIPTILDPNLPDDEEKEPEDIKPRDCKRLESFGESGHLFKYIEICKEKGIHIVTKNGRKRTTRKNPLSNL